MRASDERYQIAGLRFITVQSPAIGGRADLAVFVPEGHHSDVDLPIVVLLHGVYGSFWNWALLGGAHLVLSRMLDKGEVGPMVLVMPSDGMAGEGTAYLRNGDADYESWIMRDALDCVREAVPAVSDSSPIMLCGLSMGGYGALRLGARFAAEVAAISAHSAITDLNDLAAFLTTDLDTAGVDVAEPLQLLAAADSLPAIRFDCGVDDPLLESNRRLHRGLTAAGVVHRYQEYEGGHDWSYWTARLPESLSFFEGAIDRQLETRPL